MKYPNCDACGDNRLKQALTRKRSIFIHVYRNASKDLDPSQLIKDKRVVNVNRCLNAMEKYPIF